ncbi:hypothetical protein Q4557_05900 [Shewanella sp. 5_MG-2023]|uniref:hypothetical protein n=1 Tax=Shewanella sp. 5_MG-2023 TaxID=3062656 RepID=UPI0026E2EE23|nr:hypothetical protein [Shewanella sp. 5_MG-2023]MDO6639490.1 hypothetical protein [Shewanella sp. 5_MG-2023]
MINSLRSEFEKNKSAISTKPASFSIPIRDTKLPQHSETYSVAKPLPVMSLNNALAAFVTSKEKSGFSPLLINQHLLTSLRKDPVTSLSCCPK